MILTERFVSLMRFDLSGAIRSVPPVVAMRYVSVRSVECRWASLSPTRIQKNDMIKSVRNILKRETLHA